MDGTEAPSTAILNQGKSARINILRDLCHYHIQWVQRILILTLTAIARSHCIGLTGIS
jgi:hypothetical protein